MRTVLQGVRDKPTAEAAARQLDVAAAEGRKLFARSMTVFARPTAPAEREALQKEFGPALQGALGRLLAEKQRIYADPTLKAIVALKLDAALGSFRSQSEGGT